MLGVALATPPSSSAARFVFWVCGGFPTKPARHEPRSASNGATLRANAGWLLSTPPWIMRPFARSTCKTGKAGADQHTENTRFDTAVWEWYTVLKLYGHPSVTVATEIL